MPSLYDTIPTPRALHQRAEFGQKEASVGCLPFFSIVKSYLTESPGESYCTIRVGHHTSKEVANVIVPNEVFYEQALLVCQHLWDMGYFVSIIHPKIPGYLEKDSGVPEVYICWHPELVSHRGLPCPCWSCNLPFSDKKECVGCNQFITWNKQGGKR